jgi:hypothetical protein
VLYYARKMPLRWLVIGLAGSPNTPGAFPRVLISTGRKKRNLVMLRAFFDETGLDPERDTALVIGGFLGRVEQWEMASDAWDECLRTPPSIEYFSHRKHSAKKMLELARVISRFPLTGFCVYIRHKSLADRDANSMKGVAGSRPYDWAFLTAIEVVLEHVERLNNGETVDFIFDHRNELRACIPAFYRIKEGGFKSCYRHAGHCEPGNDKYSVALQMADLLAGEFNNCKETGKLSEALGVIIKANGLVQTTCAPQPEVNSVISLDKFSSQIKREFVAFLEKTKNVKEQTLTPEMAHEFHDLLKKNAYCQMEIERHSDRLEMDPNYQAIKKIFDDFNSNDK